MFDRLIHELFCFTDSARTEFTELVLLREQLLMRIVVFHHIGADGRHVLQCRQVDASLPLSVRPHMVELVDLLLFIRRFAHVCYCVHWLFGSLLELHAVWERTFSCCL